MEEVSLDEKSLLEISPTSKGWSLGIYCKPTINDQFLLRNHHQSFRTVAETTTSTPPQLCLHNQKFLSGSSTTVLDVGFLLLGKKSQEVVSENLKAFCGYMHFIDSSESLDRGLSIEGDTLVLASKGICLSDEFDKMNDQDCYIKRETNSIPPKTRLSFLSLSYGCEARQPIPDEANPR
ncbi:hypothetical protein LguiB_006006 [Lonicera macranthoides]